MRRLLFALVLILASAAPAAAQDFLACQRSGIITVCPGNARLKPTFTLGKVSGGFGQDVSTGLTDDRVAIVSGGAITIGALTATAIPSGIDATKIGGGTVTNTIFSYLDATSPIQAQLNGKQSTLTLPLSKSNGGFGQDVSTGLTNNQIAYVSGGAITIGAFPVAGLPAHASTHLAGGSDPLLASPGTIGGTTPGAATFTTLAAGTSVTTPSLTNSSAMSISGGTSSGGLTINGGASGSSGNLLLIQSGGTNSIIVNRTGGVNTVLLNSNTTPNANNSFDFGAAATAWRTGYFGTSLVSPSIGPSAAQQHTLPAVTSDTVALLTASQTFTGKTISGSSNTLSNIANSSLTNSSITLSCTGLSGCGTVSLGGTLSPAVSYGTSSNTATQGNDTRLPPAPSGAGKMLFDTGSAYAAITAGSSSQVMVGGTNPGFGNVPAAAIPSTAVSAGSYPTSGQIPTFTVGADGRLTAAGSSTSGSGLTSLNATNISSGTLAFARYPQGIAVAFGFTAPATPATTGLSTALAANSGSSTVTGLSNPDRERTIQVRFNTGWDGGDLFVFGTDSNGSFSETFTNGSGVTRESTRAYKTITSASKESTGASAATVTIGPGNYLGLPVFRKVGITQDRSAASCMVDTDGVLSDSTAVLNPTTGDPAVQPSSAPNGARNYHINCALSN